MLLVFANKQDLPNAMGVSELTDKLGLHSLRGRTVRINTRSLCLYGMFTQGAAGSIHGTLERI